MPPAWQAQPAPWPPFGPQHVACPYHPSLLSGWAFRGYPCWQVHLWAGLIVHLPFSSKAPGAGVESNCQDDGMQVGKRNRGGLVGLHCPSLSHSPTCFCASMLPAVLSQRALC